MIQLKPKQIEGVQACLDRKSLILDYQAGSGKTFISAEVIKRLSKEGEKFIFATQAALIPQTIAQFKKYDAEIKTGVARNEKELLKTEDCDVVFTTYTGLSKLYFLFMGGNHRRRNLFIDECHKFFGVYTKGCRSEPLIYDNYMLKRKYLMSGTFSDGKNEKFYGSLKFLGEESEYFDNYQDFKIRYMNILRTEFTARDSGLRKIKTKVLGYLNEDEIQETLNKWRIRCTRKEVYGQEIERIYEFAVFEPDPEINKIFKEWKAKGILECLTDDFDLVEDDKKHVCQLRGLFEHPKNLKIDEERFDLLPKKMFCARTEFIIEKIQELGGEKFVYFDWLEDSAKQVASALDYHGISYDYICPGKNNDSKFVNGESQGIVGHLKYASAGFNWQFSGSEEVSNVILGGCEYDPNDVEQAISRVIRGVRNSPVRVLFIGTDNAVYSHLCSVLNKKEEVIKRSYDDKFPIKNFSWK